MCFRLIVELVTKRYCTWQKRMSQFDPLLGLYITGDQAKVIAVAEWDLDSALGFQEAVADSSPKVLSFQRVELLLDACDEAVVAVFAASLQKCVIKEVEIEIHTPCNITNDRRVARLEMIQVKAFAALPRERLELSGPGFGSVGIREICKGLEMSSSLDVLHLQVGPRILDEEGLRLLAECIKCTGMKGSVEIYGRTQQCKWGPVMSLLEDTQLLSIEIHETPTDDASVANRLRSAISSNTSLRSLVLNAPFGHTTDIPPVAIFLGLTENKTLEKLVIGGIGLNATSVLAECLPAIHCLKVVKADWPQLSALSHRLVDSLRRNASLLRWVDPRSRPIPKAANLLLSRNGLLALAEGNQPTQPPELLAVLSHLSKRDMVVSASTMYICIRQFVRERTQD